MATGAVPASFTGLKSRDHKGIGFAKCSDFVRVSDLQRVKFRRTKVALIRNSTNPGSETVELEPASAGSPLLADRRAQFEKLEYRKDDYQKELEHIEQVCASSQT
ncbi:hypothetical protein DH2020_021242 [Rehmannia glutinosa]|uniref:Uncharacterized protein n=1 Tax=Rehmannia glutinosa TaxID=99300 RepID=A0ABR0W9V4_REHGL